MYHRWLDNWDERRAQRGETAKKVEPTALNGHLCFPDGAAIDTIEAFGNASRLASPDFPNPPAPRDPNWSAPFLTFPSSVTTATPKNNLVWTRIALSGEGTRAALVLHHWNATKRNDRLTQFLAWQGISVAEMALPYHLERSRPDASFADHMLSADLGQTMQSMQQAVADAQQVIHWLRANGKPEVMVIGFSLGSWVAGLVAAQDQSIKKVSLLLNGGNLADMVWSGRATRHIRSGLNGHVNLADLRSAWHPLDLATHAANLARPELALQCIYARRDGVVKPDLTRHFIETLREHRATPEVHALNCGHYSLALPHYMFPTAAKLRKFLRA